MTSPRYNVTHFLTDSNEIYTAYAKLEIKDILFVNIFHIFHIPEDTFSTQKQNK